ncbi:sulfatase [Actinopolymorpha alba]|uniref:sulfatase family protein n=1 Tax=Actinopolymorpha alba TaxID=533267 RepID=UPI00036A00DE|nr:sulfatase-like hydrolase/transferase [Actinopolymorpha alba]
MERTNVLVIQADQFRWDCFGAAGNHHVRTPNLDRLTADAVRYPNAFCTYPVCTPSRYSLLSGLYVHQHGGRTNRSTLAPHIDTFPRALRRAGYHTAAVGKMHFTPTYLDVGYDHMELAEQNGPGRYDDDYHRDLHAAGYTPVTDLLDQELEFRREAPPGYWNSFGARTSELPESLHSTTWIADRALRTLSTWATEAHLLHVSFIKPHHPFDPPAPWDQLYDPEALPPLPGWAEHVSAADSGHQDGYFPYNTLTRRALQKVMAHYYATITQLDHQVGRLLDELRTRGLYDDTLIIFTADHGEYLGFHHLLLKSGPMYDPVVKVPLLVKFPRSVRGGETNNNLVSMVDLMPTILGACECEAATSLPGHDLADVSHKRTHVLAESRTVHPTYMVRTETHKLLQGTNPAETAIFDLVRDPHETTNRIADPALRTPLQQLQEYLFRWLAFDTRPNYLDEAAPQIDAPNLPPNDPTRRTSLRAFFASQMKHIGW